MRRDSEADWEMFANLVGRKLHMAWWVVQYPSADDLLEKLPPSYVSALMLSSTCFCSMGKCVSQLSLM